LGGDASTPAFMSLIQDPTTPKNNLVAFFTGKDDYHQTRRYGQWQGLEYVALMK
jgi:hypothetical protein